MKKNKIKAQTFWAKNLEIVKLFEIFGSDKLKLVGGAVRCALRKEETTDLDFAIKLSPQLVKKKLTNNNIRFLDKSKGHGTVSILVQNIPLKLLVLEKISNYGRKAEVKYIETFSEDATRRDFTINSIYSDLDGNIYDPNNGVSDLEKNIIRFIGNPEVRIKEDFLRVLRYFRFLGVYCDSEKYLNKKAFQTCVKNFHKVSHLSKERVKMEFFKLILSKNVNFSMLMLKKNKLLDFLIEDLQSISAKNIRKINYLPKEIIIRLAFLMKETKMNIQNVKKSLNLSKNDVSLLSNILSIKINVNSEFEARINKYFYGKEVSKASYLIFQLLKNKKANNKILDVFNNWKVPSLPINGKDIVKINNINGKQVGVCLKRIEKWWVKGNFLATRKQCLQKLKSF